MCIIMYGQTVRVFIYKVSTQTSGARSGVVGARGLFDELKMQVPQPVLVIEGAADKRSERRGGYAETVPDLERVEIDGSCNVPPWERPGLVADAIGALVLRARRLGRLEAPG